MIRSSEDIDPDVMLDIMRRIKSASKRSHDEPGETGGTPQTVSDEPQVIAVEEEIEIVSAVETTGTGLPHGPAPDEDIGTVDIVATRARVLGKIRAARARLGSETAGEAPAGPGDAGAPEPEASLPAARLHRPVLTATPADRLAGGVAVAGARAQGPARLGKVAAISVLFLACAFALCATVIGTNLGSTPDEGASSAAPSGGLVEASLPD